MLVRILNKTKTACAFSLVELMMSLITISLITAAMAPVISKKISAGTINVGSFAGGSGETSTDCEGLFNADCKLCNINFCLDCEKTCADGEYKDIPNCMCSTCKSKYGSGCAECNLNKCVRCKTDFKLLEDGTCKLDVVTKNFTTAGNHTFVVPDGVEELIVTLVSGGAGGGGGGATDKSDTFVISGTGDIPNKNDNHVLHTSSTGLFDWTIPNIIKGSTVSVSACGGGGGGTGGDGGAFKDAKFLVPNQTKLKIQVGGAGGSGVQNVGTGNDNIYGNKNRGGGAAGTGGASQGTAGSLLSSGTGGGSTYYVYWRWHNYDCDAEAAYTTPGSQGGNPTLFRESIYANKAALVAPGGGGGGGGYSRSTCGSNHPLESINSGGSGGGGGGIGGGKGGNGGTSGSDRNGKNGAGAGSANTVFTSGKYCVKGKNGAMRINYSVGTKGGTGGGTGQIVPQQKISVTPGDTLTITVGAGGAGGAKNQAGKNGGLSKITDSSGKVLITTLGASAIGGNYDGTTVGTKGAITNGKNSNAITMDGFSGADGKAANGYAGGAGGQIILFGDELSCTPGGGGPNGNNGGDAQNSGGGGCGGGGGAAGKSGGKGSDGYVMIKYGG